MSLEAIASPRGKHKVPCVAGSSLRAASGQQPGWGLSPDATGAGGDGGGSGSPCGRSPAPGALWVVLWLLPPRQCLDCAWAVRGPPALPPGIRGSIWWGQLHAARGGSWPVTELWGHTSREGAGGGWRPTRRSSCGRRGPAPRPRPGTGTAGPTETQTRGSPVGWSCLWKAVRPQQKRSITVSVSRTGARQTLLHKLI